jgi:hypothetical protein
MKQKNKDNLLRIYGLTMIFLMGTIDIMMFSTHRYHWLLIPMNLLAGVAAYVSIAAANYKSPVVVVKNWVDDLIMCPSQCYLYITYKGKIYEIYLRWRHDDPWTAELCGPLKEVKSSADDLNYKDGYSYKNDVWLDIGFYSHDQLDEVKRDAYNKACEHLILTDNAG